MSKRVSINILLFARLQCAAFTAIGVVCGAVYAFGGIALDLATDGLNTGSILALLALIGMPLLFAVIGFVFGSIQALTLNLLSPLLSRVGISIPYSYRS